MRDLVRTRLYVVNIDDWEKVGPGTGERVGLLASATVGEGGWVDLLEPIIVRAAEAFIAVPDEQGGS